MKPSLFLLPIAVLANEVAISESRSFACSGVWGKGAFGGQMDPSIQVLVSRGPVSVLVYESHDEPSIGANGVIYCEAGVPNCIPNRFIVRNNTIKPIYNDLVQSSMRYMVPSTGYYCVAARSPTKASFEGVIVWNNPYGNLSGGDISKLYFYQSMAGLYALLLVAWIILYMRNRNDILPVQKYITAILGFLPLEMLAIWGYWWYTNKYGVNATSKGLLVMTAVLNAIRISFSFFLLLIVCMGYSVVKPHLEKMWACRALALLHFALSLVYGVAGLVTSPEFAGPLILFIILPLAATMTVFYLWTLNSLGDTIRLLEEQRQHQKALLYKRLWRLILVSILTVFAFFFLNSMIFAGRDTYIPNHWKSRWFILDGWLNLVYLVDLGVIAYLWRPTPNNKRFAMSHELAQDENDEIFEIESIDEEEEIGK